MFGALGDPRLDNDVADFFRRLDEEDYLPSWYDQRASGALGRAEQAAAIKTELHAATPLVAHADSLGRTFLSVAHNRLRRASAQGPATDESYETRIVFDIEGNQREVIDARGRVVMRYDYDLLGQRVHQSSMEAGERWTLANAAGNPIYGWDSRGHRVRTEYDDLQRPVQSFVKGLDPAAPAGEVLFARTEYGEGQPDEVDRNLRTRPVRQFDTAGVVTYQRYDFKGNALHAERVLAAEYKATPDWAQEPALQGQVFATRTTYDALNRPTSITTPDASVYLPRFNEASLLEAVQLRLRGDEQPTPFVTSIDYDAKGQRLSISYGAMSGDEGVTTNYEYDRHTFRLRRLTTTRPSDQASLQGLHYVYDPVGNITHIRDDAQPTIYFSGEVVRPDSDYRYDAVYRLIRARGREHIGQAGQPQTSPDDAGRVRLPHPNDGQAMRSYSERYDYDQVGNILALRHRAARGCWTRAYDYDEVSQLERDEKSNRLSRTRIQGTEPIIEAYTHDVAGNMTRMPHLSLMRWDFRDQLSASARQVVNEGASETTYYVYDGAGQRVRKVTERQNGTRKNERVYLGGFEVFREYGADGNEVVLERETLHVMDDKQRVALVETRSIGEEDAPARLVRYQLGNHLGSASLELDEVGRIISYEEYYPYGSTSYQAGRNNSEVSRKRYRYTGMERDEETGLAYHTARYYAPWLGRWMSCDPLGIAEGLDAYEFVRGRPVVCLDLSGKRPSGIGGLWDGDGRYWETDQDGLTWIWSTATRTWSAAAATALDFTYVVDRIAAQRNDLQRFHDGIGKRWGQAHGVVLGIGAVPVAVPVTFAAEKGSILLGHFVHPAFLLLQPSLSYAQEQMTDVLDEWESEAEQREQGRQDDQAMAAGDLYRVEVAVGANVAEPRAVLEAKVNAFANLVGRRYTADVTAAIRKYPKARPQAIGNIAEKATQKAAPRLAQSVGLDPGYIEFSNFKIGVTGPNGGQTSTDMGSHEYSFMFELKKSRSADRGRGSQIEAHTLATEERVNFEGKVLYYKMYGQEVQTNVRSSSRAKAEPRVRVRGGR